jgi:predicted DNA-binding transcriptional regulator AlpA
MICRWPRGAIHRWKQSLICGRAEPAPPPDWSSELGWPCGGNPGITLRVVFRRGAVSAPAWRGHAQAEAYHLRRSVDDMPVAQWGGPPVEAKSRLRACGARPSAGSAIQAWMALRGKPWHNAEVGVLGGTRSPRPRGKAIRKPRHIICAGPLMICRWPRGAIHRWKQSLICGRAEPAPPQPRPPARRTWVHKVGTPR